MQYSDQQPVNMTFETFGFDRFALVDMEDEFPRFK